MGTPAVADLDTEIIECVAKGLLPVAIAKLLKLDEREINARLSGILRNLGLCSRVELILFVFSYRPSAHKDLAA